MTDARGKWLTIYVDPKYVLAPDPMGLQTGYFNNFKQSDKAIEFVELAALREAEARVKEQYQWRINLSHELDHAKAELTAANKRVEELTKHNDYQESLLVSKGVEIEQLREEIERLKSRTSNT